MRLILRGDKLSAKKYIGFAKARLNDMKNIMSALNLNYGNKPYKLPDADLLIESSYGLDTAWIIGKDISKSVNILIDTLPITASILQPFIFFGSRLVRNKFVTAAGNVNAHNLFLATAWSAWIVDPTAKPSYTAFKNVDVPGDVIYTSNETMQFFDVTPPADLQIQHGVLSSGVYSSGSKSYLESSPSTSGTLDGSIVSTWTTMFALVAGKDYTVTEDMNAYPLLPDPATTSAVGWTGGTPYIRTL